MPRFGLNPIATGEDAPDQLDIPLSTALGATAQNVLRSSPTVGFFNTQELQAETEGRQQSDSSIARFGYLPGATVIPSKRLSAQEARQRIADAGLAGRLTVPDGGIPERALDLLVGYKRDETRNAFISDRYRGGVTGGAAQLGTALAVSLVDPLNIASAFVPVVGEARYARLLEQAGASFLRRGAVRVGVGATEGVAGAALLEPLVYANQQQLQADYGFRDSLMNLAFGGVFGAALHGGGGLVTDLFAKRAGVGAWAESFTPEGLRDVPELPKDFIGGGGTRWIDGEDYVRGQFAVVEAPKAEGHERLPIDRETLTADAAKYGLDPADVAGMADPVLVRVEGAREVGGAKPLAALAHKQKQEYVDPAQETDTPEFAAFFRNSKAVDSEQRPVLVYHGTDARFDAFSSDAKRGDGKNVRLLGEGIYFTTDRAQAESYGKNVIAAYLRVENPRDNLASGIFQQNGSDSFDGVIAKGVPGTKPGELVYSVRDPAQIWVVKNPIPYAPSRIQSESALRVGIAQAVNGEDISLGAARHLDGTPEGVAKFLEAKRLEDEANAAQLAQTEALAQKAITEGLDVEDAAALEKEVSDLKAGLREQIKAAGEDVEAFDSALADLDEAGKDLQTHLKALKGVEMCLMRNS